MRWEFYKRKQESKKEGKHAFDQESDQEKKKKIKKREGRKWKPQIKIKNIKLQFFLDIFNLTEYIQYTLQFD